MKACKVEDCPKPAGMPGTAWGWCSTHYNRWKRTGDPLIKLSDLREPKSDMCSVDGCDTARWARGFCGTHYRRFMQTGDAGAAARQWSPATGSCSTSGCRKPVRTKGLCRAHYLRLIRHGDPLGGGTAFHLHEVCSARFCLRAHYARGLCRQHWTVQGRAVARAAKLGIEIPGYCTPDQLVARIDYYANRCWMCGEPADQVDHVKPLAAGGSNWPANLRPACGPCNMRKSSRWPLAHEAVA